MQSQSFYNFPKVSREKDRKRECVGFKFKFLEIFQHFGCLI